MSKIKNVLTFKYEGLFDKGYLNVTKMFRKSLSDAIRRSQYSREQIVEMIEVLTGIRISKHILDQSLSSKSEYRFPAEVLHAFCLITGSLEPFKILLSSIGCEAIDPNESKDLEIMSLLKERERIDMEIRRLKGE